MQDRGEAIAMIERNLTRLDADSRFGSWAVVNRLIGVPVGSVILKPLPDGEVRSRSVGSFTPTAGGMVSPAKPPALCFTVGSLTAYPKCGR